MTNWTRAVVGPALAAAAGAVSERFSYTASGIVVYDHELEERIGAALVGLERMTTRAWFNSPQPTIKVHMLTDDDDAMRILLNMGLSP
jgi:hypothetical protein